MNLHSTILRITLCAVFLAASSVFAKSAAPTAKPNILVILTDDQGRGEYSDFGTKDIRTPAIDRLCHEGMTFDNFYANSCVCSPSRAALMSGCYPDRVGVPGLIRDLPDENWGWLSPKVTLLPALLKAGGYHTAIVGKWNLGLETPNLPNERGFDLFHGFLDDMMDDYVTHLRHGQNFMRRNGEVIDPQGHATDIFTEWACTYIEERSKTQEPFFLYLAYNAPHDPIQPKPEWLEKVRQREPGISEKRAKLVALIEHLDSGIGQVLDTLDRTGVAQNTLVIFTSDNGGVLANGANNGPWRSGKTHMYEGGLRVPGVARWPGQVAAGSHTGRIALTMDIFSTALEAAGLPLPAGIDGVSFLPTVRGQSQPEEPRNFYFVRREGGNLYQGETINAFRQGDWKLVHDSPFAPVELYNLKEDPQETMDLSKTEKSIFSNLSVLLRRQVQKAGSVPWQAPAK